MAAAASASPASQQQQQQAPRQAAGGPGSSGGGSSPANANGPKRISKWATNGPPNFSNGSNNANNRAGPNSHPAARSQSPLNPSGGPHQNGPRQQQQQQPPHNNIDRSQNSSAGQSAPGPTSGGQLQNVNASNEELAKMHDKMLFLVSHMIGQRVTATLRSGIVYEGILSTVNDTDLSVCLRFARQIDPSSTSSSPATVKPSLLVSARDIIDLSADNIDFTAFEQPVNGSARPLSPTIKDPGGASIMAALMNGSPAAPPTANPDTFRTDVDISSRGGPKDNRELQKWGASSAWGAGGDGGIGGSSLEGDDAAFGGLESSASGKGGKAWDQFAVNEKLFGTKTNYQEELYTTKLDKSGADYRARERKAERLAQEIQSGVASNAHVAEERGLQVDDSGLDEEDKYSGVIRGQGAYVPPGARKNAGNTGGLAVKQAPAQSAAAPSTENKAVNTSLADTLRNEAGKKETNGTTPSLSVTDATATQQTSAKPVLTTSSSSQEGKTEAEVPPREVVGDFKKFVTSEKEKLMNKKAAMQRQDKDKKFADLRSFSASFTLKTPIPSDLVPMLTKDEQRQKDLLTKSPPTNAVASTSSSLSTIKPASTNVSPNVGAATLQKAPSIPQTNIAPLAGASAKVAQPATAASAAKKASPYSLVDIPPFNPAKAAAARAAKASAAGGDKLLSPIATKFNAAAPAFVMRPTAGSFIPGGPAPSAATAATPPAATPTPTAKIPAPMPEKPANPFFGLDSPIDKGRKALTHVKEEFSPFKLGKCPDASSMSHMWGFTGKSLHSGPSAASSTLGMMSPQLAGAIPPHMVTAQMRAMHISSPAPQHMMQNMSAVGGPGPASLMRTASSSGNAPSTADDSTTTSGMHSHQASSGAPTPVPSSSTSQAGHAGPPQSAMSGFPPHMMPGQPGHPAHMLPQGYVLHPGQQPPAGFAGQHGGYRYGGPGQQGGPQIQQMQAAAGGHMQQILIGPNGQPIHFTGHPAGPPGPHGQFVQMPFSPQMHGGNAPMFSPQMGAPGQQYMPPMYVQQGGPRGTPQMQPGGQHLYYQPMGGPPQYVPIQFPGGPPQPGQPHQHGQAAGGHAQQQQQQQ